MSERLLPGKEMIIITSAPTGKMSPDGISSSYDETYNRDLSVILSREEHSEIIKRLNIILTSHWPCGTINWIGCICIPCTMGLSLLCPMICVSEAETHAVRMLENLSLKARYFDQNVIFKLKKGWMTSQFVISFPADLQTDDSTSRSIRNGGWEIQVEPSAGSFKKGK